jgi:hypothetical protein
MFVRMISYKVNIPFVSFQVHFLSFAIEFMKLCVFLMTVRNIVFDDNVAEKS